MGKTFTSDLSRKRFPESEKVSAASIRTSLLKFIQTDNPRFDESKFLSLRELNRYREKYMADYLMREVGQLSDLDKKVLDSIKEQTIITDNTEEEQKKSLTLGNRVADNVAKFGGSWTFIISFGLFLFVWILINIFWFANKGFDPYPFILLNLILSCLAAIQAPIIMMSQNRQESKDRERSKEDYMVNLKAELEVRALHEKMDHMMLYQQQELIEIQKIQIDMLSDIIRQIDRKRVQNGKPYPKPREKSNFISKKNSPDK